MKNLEEFSVQELNAKEIKETDGGFFDVVHYSLLIVGGIFALGAYNGYHAAAN